MLAGRPTVKKTSCKLHLPMMIVHALRSPISFLSVTRSGMPESRLRSLSFIILWLSVLFLSTPSISARARTESWAASLESPLRSEALWKSRAGAALYRMLTSISALIQIPDSPNQHCILHMTCVLIHTSQTITAYYTWPIYWSTLTKTSLHATHDPFTDPHSPKQHCILHMTHALIHTHQNITAYYTWPMHWSTLTKTSLHTPHDLCAEPH